MSGQPSYVSNVRRAWTARWSGEMENRKLIVACLGLLASVPGIAGAEVIYGNLAHPVVSSTWVTYGETPEVADHVYFAAGGRALSAVTCTFFVNEDQPFGTFDVTYRIRSVNGGRPGGVLAEAGLKGYQYTMRSESIRIEMPSITLPEDAFVSGQITNGSNMAQGRYGVSFANPPEIGSSDAEEFYADFGHGFERGTGFGQGWGNLMTRVEAVPEPGGVPVLIGALALLWRRRR